MNAIRLRLRINEESSIITIQNLRACTLLAIWRSQWEHIFDSKPFLPFVVAEKAIAHILRLAREEALSFVSVM